VLYVWSTLLYVRIYTLHEEASFSKHSQAGPDPLTVVVLRRGKLKTAAVFEVLPGAVTYRQACPSPVKLSTNEKWIDSVFSEAVTKYTQRHTAHAFPCSIPIRLHKLHKL
jgi:hypothetical protein